MILDQGIVQRKMLDSVEEFLTLLGELKTLGCTVPCNLEALDAFATTASDDRDVTFSSFATEGLTERVKLLRPPMYRDFLERRAEALLKRLGVRKVPKLVASGLNGTAQPLTAWRARKELRTSVSWLGLGPCLSHGPRRGPY